MMINVQVEILISYSIFFFTFSRSLDKDEKFHPININLHSLTLFKLMWLTMQNTHNQPSYV